MEPTNQGEAPRGVAKLSQVIQIDEGNIQAHLGKVVRSSVEETLNARCRSKPPVPGRALRTHRSPSGHASGLRQLHTKVGEVRLKGSEAAHFAV